MTRIDNSMHSEYNSSMDAAWIVEVRWDTARALAPRFRTAKPGAKGARARRRERRARRTSRMDIRFSEQPSCEWHRLAEGSFREAKGNIVVGNMVPRPLTKCVERIPKILKVRAFWSAGSLQVRVRNITTGEIIPGEIVQ